MHRRPSFACHCRIDRSFCRDRPSQSLQPVALVHPMVATVIDLCRSAGCEQVVVVHRDHSNPRYSSNAARIAFIIIFPTFEPQFIRYLCIRALGQRGRHCTFLTQE
jgi:hypothetical protein